MPVRTYPELTDPAGIRAAELEFHVNMLRHGRRTCHAQRPACGVCALRRMCPAYRSGEV